MSLTIGFDVDDVIFKYKKNFFEYMTSIKIIPQKIHSEPHRFDLTDVFPGYPYSDIMQKIQEFSFQEKFCNLEEYEGFTETLVEIRKQFPKIRTVAITSAGDHHQTIINRRKNLERYQFDQVTIIPLLKTKKPHLKKLPKKSVYIDDSYKHVATAQSLGLTGILFRQPTNIADHHETVMSCWNSDREMILQKIEESAREFHHAR